MKIQIIYSREHCGYDKALELNIWMRFTNCTYDEFHNYIDAHAHRICKMRLGFDIGHSDMVIYFS
jgi:hypothetical protein